MPPREAAHHDVALRDLLQAAGVVRFVAGDAVAVLPGLNQSTSGTAKNTARSLTRLATRRRSAAACAGPFSLTGQPTRWAGARSAAWPTCSRRTATWRTHAPRRDRRAVGYRVGARRARQDGGRDVRGGGARRSGAVDRAHQPRTVDARPGAGAARARALRVGRAAGKPSPTPPPRATPTMLLPASWGEKARARSPTASAASAASALRSRRCGEDGQTD